MEYPDFTHHAMHNVKEPPSHLPLKRLSLQPYRTIDFQHPAVNSIVQSFQKDLLSRTFLRHQRSVLEKESTRFIQAVTLKSLKQKAHVETKTSRLFDLTAGLRGT